MCKGFREKRKLVFDKRTSGAPKFLGDIYHIWGKIIAPEDNERLSSKIQRYQTTKTCCI